MADKAKHAFGSSSSVESALEQGLINARDILFLDEDTDSPKIGWITKDGKPVILTDEKADLSEVEADVAALEVEIAKKANSEDVETLESQIATKADSVEVEAQISKASQSTVDAAKAYTDGKVEAAISEHMVKKYEIAGVPVGTLVDIREDEIRVMCPENCLFTKQSVGVGGDPNTYYMTFKTYVLDDNVVGYIEHLGDKSDSEILTDLKTDEYGRRYQPTWLGLAKYDEATDTWSYYGANSTVEKYIGWDYQIDWYDANGVMIASDSIRINLSNENCHSEIKPYFVGEMMKEVDAKIAESMGAIEVIEF